MVERSRWSQRCVSPIGIGGMCAAALALCALGLSVLGAGSAPADSSPRYRRCGSFQAKYLIHVLAHRVSCKKARRIQKEYWLAPKSELELVGPDEYNGYVRLKRFPGWRCTSGAMGGGCRKGRREAGYTTYTPPSSGLAPRRLCGSIALDYSPTPEEHYSRMFVRASRGLRCARARTVMRRYRDGVGEPCDGSSCFISYSDGWTCNARTPGDWPLIQECRKHRIRVLGFVHSSIVGPRREQPPLTLSPSGFGAAHFGMNLRQAEGALGRAISVEPSINGCSFWTVPGSRGIQLLALNGSLAYALIYERGVATTRGIKVGDGLDRLRRRYGGKLHRGRSASLSGADKRLFVSEHDGGTTYELEFDIANGRVAFISAATRHVIETFGECA